MKNIILLSILFICLSSSDLDSITNLVRSSDLFEKSHVKIEKKSDASFLIYSTKNTQKKNLIVYSDSNFERLQFTELEKVLLFCHEIGHFRGGAPFKNRGRSQKLSWSSAEGQADYYSTAICLKDFAVKELSFKEVDNSEISSQIYKLCPDFECIKVMNSIYNIIKAYQSFTNSRDLLVFENSEHSTPMSTILEYPSNQCRLNTLKNGYFCEKLDVETNNCINYEFSKPSCWFVK